ncbi:hypothetical protein [Geomonas propionica]|uniref:Lipoprotein n=1 Tax=Geomonas propionica TaxID=2798582 RepID=A0ABS0YP68_9BACT|nr:hypothetical protein [Geomonas propionica]MBJ6799767.1 hypothetical protein [Geomonas propionica]
MRVSFIWSFFFLSLLMQGCRAPQQYEVFSMRDFGSKQMYQEFVDNVPKEGELAEVNLGNKMMVQRKGAFKECVKPSFSYTGNKLFTYGHIKEGELICRMTADDTIYTANYSNVTGSSNYSVTEPVIFTRNSNGLIRACVLSMGFNLACKDDIRDEELNHGAYFVYKLDDLQQIIEYSGKSGDTLKFTYSEFANGMARQAFTRDFQVDLKEGKIASYKGAIIEIHNATNTSIKYTIKRYFD